MFEGFAQQSSTEFSYFDVVILWYLNQFDSQFNFQLQLLNTQIKNMFSNFAAFLDIMINNLFQTRLSKFLNFIEKIIDDYLESAAKLIHFIFK